MAIAFFLFEKIIYCQRFRKNIFSDLPFNLKTIPGIFVSISNITALLTALTAFKVGRLDLIRSPSAFRSLSI
ncbi:MAG TPA: hypothetical protein C5S51_02610 [Methanosarcinaceae archaeon]|nr:hypothetical protein [Methanosarcinaceae archaeon]